VVLTVSGSFRKPLDRRADRLAALGAKQKAEAGSLCLEKAVLMACAQCVVMLRAPSGTGSPNHQYMRTAETVAEAARRSDVGSWLSVIERRVGPLSGTIHAARP